MQLEELILEAKQPIEPKPLSFKLTELKPTMSKETIDLHYNTLTKNYFKKYNETHAAFQKAGAVLHDIWWENLTAKKTTPGEKTEKLLKKKFKTVDKFKEEFVKQATTIHGNGWCSLLSDGSILQIPNHKIVKNVALLVDMWEHSYIFDYKADKVKYAQSIFEVINWDVVESRL